MYYSASVSIIKYHRWRVLNNRSIYLLVLEKTAKIKVLVGSATREGSLSGLHKIPSC